MDSISAPRCLSDPGSVEPLRSDVPGSARGWTIMRGEEFIWQPWGQILHAVETGEPPFIRALGMDWPEYLAEHPETSVIFDDAMRSISALWPLVISVVNSNSTGS